MGFDVYDYAAGKVDWLAAGEPSVRADDGERRALDAADRQPATCGLEDSVDGFEGTTLVVDDNGVLLGRVRTGPQPAGSRAEDVMEPGPSTVRAHEPLDDLIERMRKHGVAETIVTTPEGRLLGVVRRL